MVGYKAAFPQQKKTVFQIFFKAAGKWQHVALLQFESAD
jgi:hypothetical protein